MCSSGKSDSILTKFDCQMIFSNNMLRFYVNLLIQFIYSFNFTLKPAIENALPFYFENLPQIFLIQKNPISRGTFPF